MYLKLNWLEILIFLQKKLAVIIYLKLGQLKISESWLVENIYFFTKNISCNVYLKSGLLEVPIFLLKILALIYI